MKPWSPRPSRRALQKQVEQRWEEQLTPPPAVDAPTAYEVEQALQTLVHEWIAADNLMPDFDAHCAARNVVDAAVDGWDARVPGFKSRANAHRALLCDLDVRYRTAKPPFTYGPVL